MDAVKRKFGTLLAYGRFISGLGWAVSIVGVVVGLVGISAGGTNLAIGLLTMAGAVLVGISLAISGQAVSCFVSIEENTRATNEILKARLPDRDETRQHAP